MKKIIFNIFILSSIILFVMLALWQVERLRWKQALQWQLEKYEDTKPEQFRLQLHDPVNHLYKPIFAFGAFMHDYEFLLHAKYFDESRDKKQIGYHVVTPFLTDEGVIIFVNRGWIPEDLKEKEVREASLMPHNMEEPIIGIVRKSKGKAPWFMPQNMPEKNVWFWLDIPEMAKKLDEISDFDKIAPVLVQQTNLTTMDNFEYPIPISAEIKLYNEHLTYVITWFLLAFITIIMWIIWLKKNK